MNLQDFDFTLPKELIAQTPLKERTASRLMTVHRNSAKIGHDVFSHLHHYLQAGDVLVLNNTKVLPARLFGIKQDTGAKIEILLLKDLGDDRWECLVKPARRVKAGSTLLFGDHSHGPVLTGNVQSEVAMGGRVIQFQYEGIFNEILDQLGTMPLPPYIKEQLDEQERYQTVYARTAGSAAAPTAGLHFNDDYLRKLSREGIILAYVTLHVGLGTFRPVSVDHVEDHQMHAEYYEFPEETARIINQAKREGRRVIAVGTTSARTLETVAGLYVDEPVQACSGWTHIFMYPGYHFRMVDALLTNFHLPKSTLLMLVSAFAGRDFILQAYAEAVREHYRFFSFGDAMLID